MTVGRNSVWSFALKRLQKQITNFEQSSADVNNEHLFVDKTTQTVSETNMLYSLMVAVVHADVASLALLLQLMAQQEKNFMISCFLRVSALSLFLLQCVMKTTHFNCVWLTLAVGRLWYAYRSNSAIPVAEIRPIIIRNGETFFFWSPVLTICS